MSFLASIDLPSLLLCAFLMNITYAAMFLSLWAGSRRSRHFLFWGLAHALFAVGNAGLAVMGRDDAATTIPLAAVITTGVSMVWIGCRSFDRLPLGVARQVSLGLAPPAIDLVLTYGLSAPLAGRVSLIVGFAMLIAAIGLHLVRHCETSPVGERFPFARLAAAATTFAYLPVYAVYALARIGTLSVDFLPAIPAVTNLVFTNVLAVALLAMTGERSRRRMTEFGMTDPLTGTLNRSGFDRLASNASRHDNAHLVLADIDHFKALNDRWGHPAGDAALCHVAARMQAALRPHDRVARIGGEEFAILLTDLKPAEAHRIAERLREGVAREPLLWEGSALPVTASFGLAPVEGWPGGIERGLGAADRALYRAKAAGRNRVVLQ